MGICRDRSHKHRATGGRFPVHRMKRKHSLGRPPSNTKLGNKRVRTVRCRGGNLKFRALRLDYGNFSWGSENTTHKTRIMDVVYNASNNELVRTKTLVKNCIVAIDATPFKTWFRSHYGVEIGKKKKTANSTNTNQTAEEVTEEKKQSKHVIAKMKYRQTKAKIDTLLEEQFSAGRVLACVSSRPGQSGRCDGYILEGEELAFYKKKMDKKKHK